MARREGAEPEATKRRCGSGPSTWARRMPRFVSPPYGPAEHIDGPRHSWGPLPTRKGLQPAVAPKPDPQHTQEAVRELVEAPHERKKEIKLDHSLIMSEVQLLLAEKRTAFALLRTGVTVAL